MGILDRIGAFQPSPVAGQGQAGGMLTGMAPAEALFARNLGGLLGRDMRTSGERLAEAIAEIPEGEDRLEKQLTLQLQEAVRVGDRVTAAKLANTLEDLKTRKADQRKLATPKVASTQTQYFKDEQDNSYAQIMQVDSAGRTSFEVMPLRGAPESPVGKLQRTEDGMTKGERVAQASSIAAATAEGKDWAEQVKNIYAAGYKAIEEIPKLEKVLDIVEDPNFVSGGLANVLEDFKDVFGLGSADVGEFKEYTAQILTAKLEDFTGAISNQERQYLERNLAGFKRGKEINARLLRNVLEGFKKAQARALEYAKREMQGNKFSRAEWLEYRYANSIIDPDAPSIEDELKGKDTKEEEEGETLSSPAATEATTISWSSLTED
jgi:hypothetical protein